MPNVIDIFAPVKALAEAQSFITEMVQKKNAAATMFEWLSVGQGNPGNEEQENLLHRYRAIEKELSRFDELQAWARWTAEEINQILADHKVSIRLDPWSNDQLTFGVAAIYDLINKWLVEGSIEKSPGKPFLINNKPAFRLDTEKNGIEFYDTHYYHPVIRVPGQTPGDFVCLTKSAPLDKFDLLGRVELLRRGIKTGQRMSNWAGLISPNVQFDTEVDISWLVGLWGFWRRSNLPASQVWRVSQAKMQAKFALGPKGVHAKVAAAIAVTREMYMAGSPLPDYYLDSDFIVWIERDSIESEPLFSAFVPKEEFATKTVSLDEI